MKMCKKKHLTGVLSEENVCQIHDFNKSIFCYWHGKNISSTLYQNYLKGHTWDRFKLNKPKIRIFQSLEVSIQWWCSKKSPDSIHFVYFILNIGLSLFCRSCFFVGRLGSFSIPFLHYCFRKVWNGCCHMLHCLCPSGFRLALPKIGHLFFWFVCACISDSIPPVYMLKKSKAGSCNWLYRCHETRNHLHFIFARIWAEKTLQTGNTHTHNTWIMKRVRKIIVAFI